MNAKKIFLIAAVCGTWCAATASATPILSVSGMLLPSGNVQYTVFFDGNDGGAASSAFDLKVEANLIHQISFGSLPVDDFASASNFDPIDPTYDIAEDTWIDAGPGSASGFTVALPSSFAGNNGGAGGIAMDPAGPATSGAAAYASFGTAGGSTQGPGTTRIIQFVMSFQDSFGKLWQYRTIPPASSAGTIEGFIARGGGSVVPVNLYLIGVPEPGSVLLLASGVLGLVAVRPRRRRA